MTSKSDSYHGPLTRYVILRVTHASGMLGTFSPPRRVSDADMYHGTCVTHVTQCMTVSLTSGFLWSQWRGKPSRHYILGICETHNFTYLVRSHCVGNVVLLSIFYYNGLCDNSTVWLYSVLLMMNQHCFKSWTDSNYMTAGLTYLFTKEVSHHNSRDKFMLWN